MVAAHIAVLVILLPLPLSAALSCSSLSSAADCRRNGKLLPTPGLFYKKTENTTETETKMNWWVFVVFNAAFLRRRGTRGDGGTAAAAAAAAKALDLVGGARARLPFWRMIW